MSKNVDFGALAEQVAQFDFAYLITIGDQDRIHTSAVNPAISDGHLIVPAPSDRIQSNVLVRPSVSLVWPPAQPGGYSLIVDGDGRNDGEQLRVNPTRAILHRPVPRTTPPPEGSTCQSDCVEL